MIWIARIICRYSRERHESLKFEGATMINNVPAIIRDFPPDDEAEFIRHLPVLLQGKPVQEIVLLQKCYMDKKAGVVVTKDMGLALEDTNSACAMIMAAYHSFRYLLQPPHAAD